MSLIFSRKNPWWDEAYVWSEQFSHGKWECLQIEYHRRDRRKKWLFPRVPLSIRFSLYFIWKGYRAKKWADGSMLRRMGDSQTPRVVVLFMSTVFSSKSCVIKKTNWTIKESKQYRNRLTGLVFIILLIKSKNRISTTLVSVNKQPLISRVKINEIVALQIPINIC